MKNFIQPKNKICPQQVGWSVFLELGMLFSLFFSLSDNITDLQLAVDNSVLLVTKDILACKPLVGLVGLLLSGWRTQETFGTVLSQRTLTPSFFTEGFTWVVSYATDPEPQHTNVK